MIPLALAAALVTAGCSKSNTPPNQAQQPTQAAPAQAPNQDAQQAMNPGSVPPPPPEQARQAPQQGYAPSRQPAYAPAPAPAPRAPSVIPAGTHLVVSLGETLSTKTSQTGDSFDATVVDPVIVHGVTLIRSGSRASGTVVDAKSLGHFKGQAVLSIRLDSVRAEGRTYHVSSSTVERVEKGKGKRTGILTGGGAGLGAIIGGLAGGGKGALIGGLAGAGAGAGGSAFTGNKDLVIPAESRLTFRVEHPVNLE